MIAGDAHGVGCRKAGGVWFFVCVKVLGQRQRRLQKSEIANSREASVLRYLFFVNGEYGLLADPPPR
jgi:hypothetical protein